jgi:integrating conjugative element protein (TIGR03761 family)
MDATYARATTDLQGDEEHTLDLHSESPTPDEGPGVLRGSAVLVLQTRQAQRIVRGRSYSATKPAIIGLLGFANLVRAVWQGARADDPYADWWLLKIDDALGTAEAELGAMAITVDQSLEAYRALRITPPESLSPARIRLHFSNPYAFRAALVVGCFDSLACKVLSARHVGLLSPAESGAQLQAAGRIVRRTLQSAVGYRALGVTRADLGKGTAVAARAREAMGGLPAEVLSGQRRAPMAPRRTAKHVNVQPPKMRSQSGGVAQDALAQDALTQDALGLPASIWSAL